MNLTKRVNVWLASTHPFMAISSALFAAIFVILVLIKPELASKLSDYPLKFIAQYFSSYLIWCISLITIVMLLLTLTPYGKVTLGKDDEQPEFSRFSWFAMLFSAGVGTGILFWGVAEPIFHLQGNPFQQMDGVTPLSVEASRIALRITLFHWGLHGWAVYSMVGLCLGYFAFRKGLPLTIRSSFYPLIGKRIYGPLGHTIDLLAVFSTLFGITVSLGLGVSQMASGINYLFGIEATPQTKLVLVLIVSTVATVSAVSGVNRGIRRLSEFNIWLTAILLCFILLAGPTVFILHSFITSTANYVIKFLPMGMWVDPSSDNQWQGTWTLFYWGWWIAWGPFVGLFMARVSRGRSLREYIIGTILVPVIASFFFLSVLGATALDMQLNGAGTLIDAVNKDMTQALFTMFELLQVDWATWLIVLIATTMIITWFVTSSDSGTLVISMIVCFGQEHPPKALRVFWGIVIALVAGLLLVGGGLRALQAASTAIAIPFAAVLLFMMFGLFKSLWKTELRAN